MLHSDFVEDFHKADFSYCPSRRTLSVGDKIHQLNFKTSQVLQQLIDADGDIVSRERLIYTVWEDNYLVGDKGISTAIWNIRKCFKSNTATANSARIETIPKKGYRLCISNASLPSIPSQISPPVLTKAITIKGIAIIAIVVAMIALLAQFFIPKQVDVTVVVDGGQVTKQIETTE